MDLKADHDVISGGSAAFTPSHWPAGRVGSSGCPPLRSPGAAAAGALFRTPAMQRLGRATERLRSGSAAASKSEHQAEGAAATVSATLRATPGAYERSGQSWESRPARGSPKAPEC